MTVSVIIPTYNCEKSLPRCLDSVAWADEILVIDMGSTDQTIPIAKKYNAKIFTRIPKNGNFDSNRKLGMQKASSDWILKLDSDEVLSLALQNEIKLLLKRGNTNYNGFKLYNQIYMFDHKITRGFVKTGSNELRLVRNGFWKYNPFRFHQQITITGETGFLNGYYCHYNVSSVSEFIAKMNNYTRIDSKYYPMPISKLSVFIAPFKTFYKLYFWQFGFLDGQVGLVVCVLFAIYNLTEKVKAWELQNL